MANLAKLDETILELEEQAKILSSNNGVIAKLDEFNSQIERTYKEVAAGAGANETIRKSLLDALSTFQKSIAQTASASELSLAGFEKSVVSSKDTISQEVKNLNTKNIKKLEEIKGEVEAFLVVMHETETKLGKIHGQKLDKLEVLVVQLAQAATTLVGELRKANEDNIDQIVSANRRFHRDFEDTVNSRLERFSSDIQVTIRQERSQMQDAIISSCTAQFLKVEELLKHDNRLLKAEVRFTKLVSIATIILVLAFGITLVLVK